jgi:hypothetical protein
MSNTIRPNTIVHWGKSPNRYRVWVVRDGMARIADPYGNRNYGVPVDRLTVASDQSVPEGAKRAPSALAGGDT